MDFASDNAAGASRPILEALLATNDEFCPAYGADRHTAEAERALSAVFEREVASFLVATGTGANALALGKITPPWGAVFCHEHAHIIDDECGAPEMFSGGAKLVSIPGTSGKITPAALRDALGRFPRGLVKQVQPAALSLSQATECGTIYTCNEIAELAAIAHAAGVSVHMDGARFVNSIVALGCSPAEMTWKAGIDALSFGATKNGALACEAVIFFDRGGAADFVYQRKRGGHTLSKGRFLGVQMCAYLKDGHWLDLARHANACAARLEAGVRRIPGVRFPWPRQVNELFVILPKRADAALKAAGARYYDWGARSLSPEQAPRDDEVFVRLISSFATKRADIDRFVAIVANSAIAA
ncbi:MAG TPA: beta-eliminating lyase-related protein [Beijerinckiaceae bacterium]|jgi:threonine aldolase|nr:beta-eliminating lyase-related protein [Beijerinckiaceae bacterium]